MRLRALLALAVLAFAATSAQADPPAVVVIRNHGESPKRVQIALGNTFPCDSSDNQLVFDSMVDGREAHSFPVAEDCVCARHTVGDWTTEFGPSLRVCGGLRCTGAGRGRSCVRDASQPIRVDVL